ncbi:LemA family protein [Marichromatium bheemlicum]|uniref:LemA family protein n=1 Tax=Marichromatium bheemlicum TaxID=365339 RepID=A0ABX1I9A1_9GAMM|nr:LemA family protein [Marichromatium bheemlicum]NKN34132.1 LemA family protein [Marichromatium bheemlicum]
MSPTLLILLVALALLAVYAVAVYNALVRLKHQVAKNWSNIDIALKQRHDELPKLVSVCRQYMRYEQETLERVVEARGAVFAARERGDLRQLGTAETSLRAGLGQLLALAESYPELQADRAFRDLGARISQLEDTIADRRELYNDSVNLLNVRIAQFPDLLIARRLGFTPADLLEFSEARADVDLDALFG